MIAADSDITLAHRLIRTHLPPAMADLVLFGSRARGTARRFSDVDVAIRPKQPLPPGLLAELREALTQSNLLIEVDLIDWNEADDALRASIEQEGIPWND
ncbi:MAG: nucleotidyltransferase domain-containing protein [Alphaproteobacteria bacterium CG_4_10_14_0_2_um_filter_63_37]|nr:MAG: hypothetical protein AUJ55_03610 [Proteobacteria bacterium CG1_02_64_396]PJA25535.1 MAG: nucleotidyltransferase domain-containing protein [Alphaproteobacteria bacterium CG_4_10_14_0_2_um_filter_63_37]